MKYIVSQESDGKWIWHLQTNDGATVAASIPRFREPEDCRSAIALIQHSKDASVLTQLKPFTPRRPDMSEFPS